MAGSGKRGGGDRILESRHLVGLFLGVVLLCGVFFTLGYVMGRTQYGGPVHADVPDRSAPEVAASPKKPAETEVTPSPAPVGWDSDPPAPKEPETGVGGEPPAAIPTAPAVPPPAPAPRPELKPVKSTRITKSVRPQFVVQVAALTHQSDALAMTELLQHKHFPALVVPPSAGEKLYRVQVGPYGQEHEADAAKTALDRAGFKAIIKR